LINRPLEEWQQGEAIADRLIACDSDRADDRAGLVRDANGPYAFGLEIAVQFFQLLTHKHHGGTAGRIDA
jgi:hypothetical protein